MTTAAEIVSGLGGKWRAPTAMVRCPAHDDRSPSMRVTHGRDGRPMVYCCAGCSGDAIRDALRSRGLWPKDDEGFHDPAAPTYLTTKPDGLGADDRHRRKAARQIWEAAIPLSRTPGERYFRQARGIAGKLPECLRYAPRLKHPSGYEAPAIVARICSGLGEFSAIQRIFIEPDGSRSKLEPRKMGLGPMLDGAVNLGSPDEILGIAEGIETALAARDMFRITTWACLGATRLGRVTVPDRVEQVWIFADNGDVGRREAYRAARIYEGRGLTVIVRPPDGDHEDHNAWLLADAGRAA